LALIRPNAEQLDSIYLAKQLSTSQVARYFSLHASGSTRYGLPVSAIEAVEIPTPPKPEQSKIAEILSTVDRAIEQTEALIAKQQRIKTGLMQDLLTRGIDEHGNLRSEKTHKFKDSPLGRIPVEWEVVDIDEIAKITTGGKDTQDRDASGMYPFFVRSQTIEKINSFSFDGEGVLTAGDGVGVGKVFHYYKGKFDFHQRVYCIHSFANDMDGYFFFHYFRLNFMSRVSQFSAKGSVDSVRRSMIAKMLIPKPSQEEQVQSVEILRKAEILEVDSTETLSKLRSLKTALMQDLLTGKKRVTPLLEVEAA
jgi:type I restriction enzyme S subunit